MQNEIYKKWIDVLMRFFDKFFDYLIEKQCKMFTNFFQILQQNIYVYMMKVLEMDNPKLY